jgi:hypothetical protein
MEWLAVDAGGELKTYIKEIDFGPAPISSIATAGVLALQLHSGDNNDIYFRILKS